jgi:GLPGLI family protein
MTIILSKPFSGNSQSFSSLKFKPVFRATYEFNFCPDSLNRKDVVTKKMYLFIGDSISYFINADKFYHDSILNNQATFKGLNPTNSDFSQKIQEISSTLPKTQDNFLIMKNRNSGLIKFIDLIGLDYYYYEEHTEIFNWKVESGLTIYNTMQCKSATIDFRGRKYKALFNTNIPLFEGPYKFSNLPGLIVEIIDALGEVEYKLTAFETYSNSVTLISGERSKSISREKMRELKVQHFLNPFISAETSLTNFKLDENQKASIIENRKKILEKRGNRIEKD